MKIGKKIVQTQKMVKKLLVKPTDLKQLFHTQLNISQVSTKNCENMIGSIEVPVGIAGPVVVKGRDFIQNKRDKGLLDRQPATEELILPLATTEGALVASVNRGCKAINHAGGVQVFVKKIGMTRAPVFTCGNGQQARDFVAWLEENFSQVKKVCEASSQHLKLTFCQSWIRGRLVFVRFVFDTDQAMGMNMVTIALKELWQYIQVQQKQVKNPNFSKKSSNRSKKNEPKDAALAGVKLLSLSGNFCVDKKDSQINRLLGRGYWVDVEVFLPQKVLKNVLKTTAVDVLAVHQAKNLIGSNLAGSFSQNMQAANVIAAMYLATGQDVAHVVEGSQAATVVEVVTGQPTGQNLEQTTNSGKFTTKGLYFAVSLPNINVGVVGGGTYLAAQSQARKLIRKGQDLSAAQLAGAVGVGVLAAEISGMAALASHSLAQAHQKLAR